MNYGEFKKKCQFEAVSEWAYDLIMSVCAAKDKDEDGCLFEKPGIGLAESH